MDKEAKKLSFLLCPKNNRELNLRKLVISGISWTRWLPDECCGDTSGNNGFDRNSLLVITTTSRRNRRSVVVAVVVIAVVAVVVALVGDNWTQCSCNR